MVIMSTRNRLYTEIDLAREYAEADFEKKFMKSTKSLPKTFLANATPIWVQLVPSGSVVYRENRLGESREIRFSRKVLDDILDVFSRYKNPIVIDFNHNSRYADMHASATETAGFCDGLAINGEEMLAHYLLNPNAVDGIRKGHCAFSSPTLIYDVLDRKTNIRNSVEMPKIALTSDPAIDGQEAINLTRGENMPGKQTKPGSENQPPDNAPAEGDKPAPEAGSNPLQVLADAAGIPIEAIGDLINERLEALVAVLKGETLAVDKTKKGELTNMANQATIDEDRIVMLTRRVDALTTENTALKSKQAEAEKLEFARKLDGKVAELLSNGFLAKEDEDRARRLFTTDWKLGEEFFSRKIVPIGPAQAGPDPKDLVPSLEQLSDIQRYRFQTAKASNAYPRASDAEIIKAVLEVDAHSAQGA